MFICTLSKIVWRTSSNQESLLSDWSALMTPQKAAPWTGCIHFCDSYPIMSSRSFTSVSIFSVWCCSRYLSLWTKRSRHLYYTEQSIWGRDGGGGGRWVLSACRPECLLTFCKVDIRNPWLKPNILIGHMTQFEWQGTIPFFGVIW
jgi:hypothetical protein